MNRTSPPTFPAVYREHSARIRRAVERAGVSERHRDDVVQEALLRIHEALPRDEPGRKLAPWILRIAYFAAVDHLRRAEHREQPTAEIDLMDERTEKRTPEQAVETREAARVFCDVASVLPEPQRIVFLMHEIDDLTLPDIAEALEIPLGTVSSRLQRARQAFDAAVARRRVVEERRRGGAAMLPLFLGTSEALIETGRAFPKVSAEETARMWGRVTRATATGTAAGALSRLAALRPSQIASVMVLVGGTGLVVGAVVTAAILRSQQVETPIALIERSARADVPVALASASAVVAPQSPASVVAAPSVTSTGAQTGRAPESSERAERSLLDHARASLQHGDLEAARRELAKHARQFPAGIYVEERESMERQVAALLGRNAEQR